MKHKSITVSLDGGLGNQMFQYAAGRAQAIRTSARLFLDLSKLLERGHRDYGLGHFRLEADPGIIVRKAGESGVRRIQAILGRIISRERCFRESSYRYDKRIMQVSPPARIEGYFQSELYFYDSRASIRRDFTPCGKEGPKIEALAKRLLDNGSTVSLHVRRGDYLNADVQKVHGLLDVGYYLNALDLVRQRVGREACICVFTDDPGWVRANLPLPGNTRFISEHTNSPLQDLCLMARCSHHITANSSFSWWGAWLNPCADKIVVTPARWFNPSAGINTEDLRPPGWLQI